MEIKNLTREMLEFRLGNDPEIDTEWFVAHLDDVIRNDPDGCFALCDDNRVIGMITSTVYQEIGWLGWLFVLEQHRLSGLGEQLMRQGIDYIRSRGVKTTLLEADLKATSLYERLGFERQFKTQHFILSRGELKAGRRVLAEIRPVTDGDLEQVVLFDREYFHQDRLNMFRTVFANPGFRGWVGRVEGKTSGYMFVTEATENQQVSPLVIDPSPELAEEVAGGLIREAFKACPKPLYFRCPMVADDRADTLRELGATEVNYYTMRMFLGESYKTERKGVLSLGCPGKG
ncbi:MAG: GNAT family N-acetyltransferase [Candidatus Zixiibacteriota bacterium]|nr:MAG: GNAT family N-acetyltransferase [candidate division Zixibacteria bacterium]